MKKARMNISHSRFILFKLKIFGEIVTTYSKMVQKMVTPTDHVITRAGFTLSGDPGTLRIFATSSCQI